MATDQNPAKATLADHRFAALETHLDALIAAYRRAPDSEAQDALSAAGKNFDQGSLAVIDRWRAERPDSALAMLACGLAHTDAARAARGGGSANQVSGDQWRLVERHFKEAEQHLRPLLDDERSRVPAGILLDALIVREQISGSRTRAEKFFARMLERDPHWLDGWRRIQAIRDPRWGGSQQDMEALLDLARQKLPERAARDLAAMHWWWRGSYAYGWADDARSALTFLEKGLALAERSRTRGQLQEYRAYAFADLKQTDEELAAWQAAVAENPGAEYYCRYGWALEEAGKMPEAIAAKEEGARLDGEYAATCAIWLGATFHDGRSGAHPELSDHARAIVWLERAMAVGTKEQYSEAANMLGLIYFESDDRKDLAKAEQLFRQASDSGDHAYAGYGAYNLARLLDEQGKSAEALACYRLAASRGHEASTRIVGSRLGEMTDDDAEAWLLAAVANNVISAHIDLARRRLRQGRVAEAEILLWQGAAYPAGTRAAYVLGRALLEGRLGDVPDPEAAYQLLSTASGSKDFDVDCYADFFLTFYVAVHEKFCRVSWLEYRGIRKCFITIKKRFKKQPELASDAQRQELTALMHQLLGNRLSWLVRKWLGKLPTLARTAPFPEFS
jgi:tetratricopeptide (TPR) repeat protein